MQQITCNHASLISAALSLGDKCEQISAACADQQEMFNFFKLYLCHLNANNVIFAFIAIFLAVFLTKFIIAVVDEYMAPAIVNLCDFFRMSEALAGVTLIAFANGLAEVITVLVVSDSPAGDVSYTIGTLYGTGLFILSLVIAMAIHVSPKPIKVFPSTIYRDLLFYIIATLMIIFMAYTGKVTWVSGLLMLCLYVLLVVLVVACRSLPSFRPPLVRVFVLTHACFAVMAEGSDAECTGSPLRNTRTGSTSRSCPYSPSAVRSTK